MGKSKQEPSSITLFKSGKFTLGTLITQHTSPNSDQVYWLKIFYKFRKPVSGPWREVVIFRPHLGGMQIGSGGNSPFKFWFWSDRRKFKYKVKMHYRPSPTASKRTDTILTGKNYD